MIKSMSIMKYKRGKVFYRYLLSYIPILLIPLILGFALFNKSQVILNKESKRANELLLGQMTSYLDMIMSDVQQLTQLVSYNLRFEGLIYETLPIDKDVHYRTYLLAQEFEIYQKANINILDFYVYIPGIDMVITPWGIHKSRSYIQNWLPNIGIGYDDWLFQFSSYTGSVYKESKTETVGDSIKDTISILSSMKLIDSMNNPRGWLVIHIDINYFHDVFKNTRWTDESLFVVYHEDSGIVTTSDPSIPLSDYYDQIDRIYELNDSTNIQFRGRDYIFQFRESEVISKLKYISLVPENIYMDQFISMTRFATLLFLITFLVGSYLIYRFSVARYKPVNRLLELLKPATDGRVSLQSDEFSLIANFMEMTIEEDKKLKEVIKQSEIILAQRYMKQLLKGAINFDDVARSTLFGYGVKFQKPYNCLILIDIELDEEADLDNQDIFIQKMWFEGKRQHIFTIRDLNGAVGFLINHDENDFNDLYESTLMQKKKAEAQLPLFLAIGISNVHHNLDDLSILYTEALKALDFRLVKGRQFPINFSDVKTSNRSYYYPIAIEVKLINSIKTGERESAAAILEDVYIHNFTDYLPSLEIARCLMFDLISTMIKTLTDISSIEEDPVFWEKIKPITTLMSCRSFDQLRVEMGEILERVCDYVIEGKPNKNDILKKEIIQFIEKKYRDKNLSPELMATHLNRNKAYICRLFKDPSGIGISTYIKRYRVEEAKKLMIEENLSVVKVANLVGFSGSNSFIRAFKEFEGITPGQFMHRFLLN